MSYTAYEIEEKINEHQEKHPEDFEYGNPYKEIKYGDLSEIDGLGKIELIDEFGGEGQGDDYWVVFKVGDQLFRKDGWYASYDGGELDGELYEVEPVEVQRTEYNRKK